MQVIEKANNKEEGNKETVGLCSSTLLDSVRLKNMVRISSTAADLGTRAHRRACEAFDYPYEISTVLALQASTDLWPWGDNVKKAIP